MGTAWGFLYNTQTEEMVLLESELYESSAAYGVNNEGYAAGWVDDLDWQTFRMPAVFGPDGEIILVSEEMGELSEINNNGIASGYMEEDAILYDVATGSVTVVPNDPDLFWNITFTDVSENGVAVGYGETPAFSRLPLIYHPSLGGDYVLLKDFLEDFDIDTSEFGGTAYKISRNGNYMAGFTDGPAVMAIGWAIYFDDYFAEGGEENECWQGIPSVDDFPMAWRITLGQDFRVAEDFTVLEESTFTVNQLTFDTNNPEVPDYAIINIREDNGEQPGAILHTIEMEPSSWEEIGFTLGDPIYKVVFDLDEPIEFGEGMYWVDPQMSIPSGGDVWWGGTNLYEDGLTPRTSSDNGETWLSMITLHMAFTISGFCDGLDVTEFTNFDFSYYPNPVTDMLHIQTAKNIQSLNVFNMAGQQVMSQKAINNGQINVSALPQGVYVFRVVLEGGQVETFKIIKK